MLYSDVNPYHPWKGNLQDYDAVRESLLNILTTKPRERLNNPEFAVDLEELLFEPIDDITALAIYQRIEIAINRWDNRIIVDGGKSNIIPRPDDNRYDVLLVVKIKGFNQDLEIRGELEKEEK